MSEITRPDVGTCLSPSDSRYWDAEVARFFSAQAKVRYLLRVEAALVDTLHQWHRCPRVEADSIITACQQIQYEEVLRREKITKHDINALVACIRDRVPESAKPYVHLGATSFDIRGTADILQFREATFDLIVPQLRRVINILMTMTRQYAHVVQVGRTHLQHAVPVTLGFTLAEYVYRLTNRTVALHRAATALRGKFSGATGASNALTLLVGQTELFEEHLLDRLGLKPAGYSSQIIPPEETNDLLFQLISAGQVMACLANTVRMMCATEYGEFVQELEGGQVGSSAMPQKVNPVDYEFVCSLGRHLAGQIVPVLLNQQTDFQRDLRDSAASRWYGEIFHLVYLQAKRLESALPKLRVDEKRLQQNLEMTQGAVLTEAFNVLLAKHGHPNAHHVMLEIARKAREEQRSLQDVAFLDPTLAAVVSEMSEEEQAVLRGTARYVGMAQEKAHRVVLAAQIDLGKLGRA